MTNRVIKRKAGRMKLDYDTLQQPSPLIEVESTTTSDTVEYSTSSTTWQELIKAEE